VQTGVKSFGCENKIPQLSPNHACNDNFPSEVSAVKSGAKLFIFNVSFSPFFIYQI
jgi:hypothetical protein